MSACCTAGPIIVHSTVVGNRQHGTVSSHVLSAYIVLCRLVSVKRFANAAFSWHQFCDTLVCVLLSVPDMTYNVFSGTLNPAQSINLVAYWSESWHATLSFLCLLSRVELVLCTAGCSWLVRSCDARLSLELHTEWWWWCCDWQLSITCCRCWCGGWHWSTSSPADDGARQLHHCTRLRGQSRQFCCVYLRSTWPAFFVLSVYSRERGSWPSSANMPVLLYYQDNALIAEMLDAAFVIVVIKSHSCYWYLLLMCCNKLWLVQDPQMLPRFKM